MCCHADIMNRTMRYRCVWSTAFASVLIDRTYTGVKGWDGCRLRFHLGGLEVVWLYATSLNDIDLPISLAPLDQKWSYLLVVHSITDARYDLVVNQRTDSITHTPGTTSTGISLPFFVCTDCRGCSVRPCIALVSTGRQEDRQHRQYRTPLLNKLQRLCQQNSHRHVN